MRDRERQRNSPTEENDVVEELPAIMDTNDYDEADAEDIVSGRTCDRTKECYKGKIKTLKKWMKLKHPNVFGQYFHEDIESFSLKKAIKTSAMKEFFGFVQVKVEHNGINSLKSVSMMQGFVSAIRYMNHENEIEEDKKTTKFLKDYMDGYKRKIATLKLNGQMSSQEGRQPFSIQGYRYICGLAMDLKGATVGLTLHAFSILCWNLMARSVTV